MRGTLLPGEHQLVVTMLHSMFSRRTNASTMSSYLVALATNSEMLDRLENSDYGKKRPVQDALLPWPIGTLDGVWPLCCGESVAGKRATEM